MNQKSKWFEIKVDLGEHKKGKKVCLEVTENGVPLDDYWKRRFLDKDIAETKAVTRKPLSEDLEKKGNKKGTKPPAKPKKKNK